MSEKAKKEIVISEGRDFKGIWIPERLYLSPDLSPREKFLLIEIYSLTQKNKGCFASNKHFANFIGLKENSIQKMLLKFEQLGLIERIFEYKENTKEIDKLKISCDGLKIYLFLLTWKKIHVGVWRKINRVGLKKVHR